MHWEWVNKRHIFIFGWTAPYNSESRCFIQTVTVFYIKLTVTRLLHALLTSRRAFFYWHLVSPVCVKTTNIRIKHQHRITTGHSERLWMSCTALFRKTYSRDLWTIALHCEIAFAVLWKYELYANRLAVAFWIRHNLFMLGHNITIHF